MSTLKICIEGDSSEVKELLAKLEYQHMSCFGPYDKKEQESMPPYPDIISGNLVEFHSEQEALPEDSVKEKDRDWYKEQLRNAGVDFSDRSRLATLQDLWESWLESQPEDGNTEESVVEEASTETLVDPEVLAPEETGRQEAIESEAQVQEQAEVPEPEIVKPEEKEVSVEYMREECKLYGTRMKSLGHENPTHFIKEVIRIFGKAEDSYKVEPRNRQAVIDACQSNWEPVNGSEDI